jgi:hypothetical protein
MGNQLSHVRNVEHANIFSHSLVFLHDAGVLNRHKPARERRNLRAAPNVFVVKRRTFLPGFGHAASLDFAIGVRNAPQLNELAG